MTSYRFAISLGLALALGACSVVTSTHPVGSEPLLLTPEDWEGTWIHGEGALTTLVKDVEAGTLEVAWIEEGETGLEMKSYPVLLRTFEDAVLASVRFETDADPPVDRHVWLRVGRESGSMILWLPRVREFKALVQEGVLPGKIEEGDVVLDQLTEEHLQTILSEEHGVLFDWEHPATLLRMYPEID